RGAADLLQPGMAPTWHRHDGEIRHGEERARHGAHASTLQEIYLPARTCLTWPHPARTIESPGGEASASQECVHERDQRGGNEGGERRRHAAAIERRMV